ncbi:MAG: DEAD/DEAH box helicase [Candidatus Bathyarchaeia archaeon]
MPGAFGLLSKPIQEQVSTQEWKSPTKIQELSIPAILEGSNVLLIAPTGAGKTEAAVLPVFELFLRMRSLELTQGVSILYITPLRALNRDIFRRIITIGEGLSINVEVRHGDTAQNVRRLQALRPPNMLITTPETFQAILPGQRMKQHLKGVQWVIVDEVHELAQDKRGAQLSIGLERLRELTGREFQRIGLSATVGDVEHIARYLIGEGRQFKVLQSFELKHVDVTVESPSPSPSDEEYGRQLMLPSGSISRIRRILELVERNRATLVFTNTREHAEAISSRILALQPDAKVGVHHGSLSKETRTQTELDLKEGKLKAVICTSSLELGIDVGNVDFVVQYMSPRQVTRLVQRVGRSGHIVGGVSKGIILASWPDDILESAVIASFAKEGILEEPVFHMGAMDVLAHQLVGLVLDRGRIHLTDLLRIVRRSWLYRETILEEILEVIKQLEQRRIIWNDGESIRKRFPHCFRYYYSNLSMIVDVKHLEVIDFVNHRKVGTLDQEFIAESGEPGKEFVIHGQTWRILGVDEEQGVVQVEPVLHKLGAIPAWEGENIPVPHIVAQKVGEVRGKVEQYIKLGERGEEALVNYRLTAEAAAKIVDIIRRQVEEGYPVPTDKKIVIEAYENYLVVHSCMGDLVNETLAKALASIISGRFGVNVGTKCDPYRIVFITPVFLDPEIIKKDLENLQPEELDRLIEASMSDTSLFAWRLWNVAKRFGIIEKNAEFTLRDSRLLPSTLLGTPVYKEALREIAVEKMDIKNTKQILRMIRAGQVEVVAVSRRSKYSPLALPILDFIAPQDVLRPVVPSKAIINAVKERLDSYETRLVCLFQADYDAVRTIRRLPERLRCPNCGSTLIAATYKGDGRLIEIAKKKIKGTHLTPEEEKIWKTAWRSASLIQNYGKKALIAMAGRGIGPINAVRILRSYHRTEEDLYLNIIKAERNYLRTRMFWES